MTQRKSIEQYIATGQQASQALTERTETIRSKKFDTIAVRGIYDATESMRNQGSILEPLYLSSAQHFENSNQMEAALTGQIPAWAYSRIHNPTVGYLEATLALLESYGTDENTSACATSSGMSAVFMATNPFLSVADSNGSAPANIVVTAKCYGGTFMLFTERYQKERGIEVRWIRNTLDLGEWEAAIDKNTRFVFGEMPSNPSLSVFDVAKVAALSHAFNIPLIVDSTLSTPALMRPIQHGADIVIHSVSKTMTNSGFAIAGAVVAKHNITSNVGPDEMRTNFAQYIKFLPGRDYGPCLSPFNALMTLNDLRTLRSNVDLLSRNTMQVANFLAAHPNIDSVNYPGLPSFEGHDLAKRYLHLVDATTEAGSPTMRYGHLLSFTVKGGHETTRNVLDRMQIIWRATDLGRIKSVATIPAISTHQQQGEAGRDLANVPSNLIRLSVGAENALDIIDDLDQALA